MGSLRARVLAFLGRRYLARQQKKGFDLERMSSFLPESALMPLKRDGLDPVPALGAADGPVDLWQSFALPIPSLTICELLGVSYEDREDFQRLSTARFDLFGGATASLGAISESLTYLLDVVRRQ